MSDIIDLGNETAEFFNDLALRERKPTGPAPTGWCLNCEEILSEGERWCDAECRDDWEKRQ